MKTLKFTPLTPKQRSMLGQLAKRAWKKQHDSGAIDEDETTWRHREAMEATSGFKISEAPKRCFDALKAHFETMAGDAGKAFETLTGPDNETRQLAHEIGVAAKACGVTAGYVAGICRRMFGCDSWSGAEQGRAVLIALKKKGQKAVPTEHTEDTERNQAA